ncbi:cytochrome b-c1 complex subunit 7-like [Atheta coriaria]|uniref:cytochrome b-c1 complex subunit 7-like n=1 Tax=Dalotia coriaria TaxID=877792 RepID=UPI0031F3D359
MAFRSLMAIQRRSMSQNITPLKKMMYNLAGFNKLGLMRDDCLYEDEDVKKALLRVPKHIIDERNYRILRAVQLDIQKDILPKEQWTKLEDDVLYLTPHVDQVIKEREEQEDWNKKY